MLFSKVRVVMESSTTRMLGTFFASAWTPFFSKDEAACRWKASKSLSTWSTKASAPSSMRIAPETSTMRPAGPVSGLITASRSENSASTLTAAR